MQRNFGGILRLRSISAERKRKGEREWGKRKYDFGVNLQDSRKHQGPREAGAGSLCRMRAGGALAKSRGPARPAGAVGARPGRGRRPYLCLHCKTPVAGAPGSSCRRRPGGAASPAAGGRTRAAGCGPRRPWRAEGRGSRTRASRRRLGSGRSPLAPGPRWSGRHSAGALSSPALTRHTNFLGSRSRGAARRARGAAGGAEARAGWGAASERVRAPRTWSRVLHCLLWMCALRVRAEPAFYCAQRRFGSAPRWRAANAGSGSSRPPPSQRASRASRPSPKSGFCCAQPGTARAPSCAPGFPPLGAAPLQPPRSPEVGGGRTLQADSAQWTLTQHSGLAVHLSRAPGDPPITPSPPAWRGRCTLPDSLPPLGSLRFWPGIEEKGCATLEHGSDRSLPPLSLPPVAGWTPETY